MSAAKCLLAKIIVVRQVSRRLRHIVQTSPGLQYKIALSMSGYTDEHLHPNCTLDMRRRLLSDMQRTWTCPGSFALVEVFSFTNLSYWPVRDGVLLRNADPEGDDKTFDVSVTSHKSSGPPTISWDVKLPVTESGILCIDPAQDLIVVRSSIPNPGSRMLEQLSWFCCTPLSLRTGAPHPRAKQHLLRFKISNRVQNKPHYTRVQVFDGTLAVSMASGFQFFTEIAIFDWTTGEQIAVSRIHVTKTHLFVLIWGCQSFCSSPSEQRTWGDPAVLISPICFLLASYSRNDQTPCIEVHVIDCTQPLTKDSEGNTSRPAVHIASYLLPRTRLGEVRMLMTPSSPHQVWAEDESLGYFSTRPDSLMLRVYIYNTQFQLKDAGFFMPLRPFFDEVHSYFGVAPEERGLYLTRIVSWARWMKDTRWLISDGLSWMQEVRRNQKGVGSRYIFPRHIVDFSSLAVTRAIHTRRDSATCSSRNGGMVSFPSDTDGYTVHLGTPAATKIAGSELFKDPIECSLPYREKMLPELPGYSPDSDLHFIGDKLISVEVRNPFSMVEISVGLICSTSTGWCS
jgi:hypothetical protein